MFLNKDAPHFVLKNEPDIITSIQDEVKELPEANTNLNKYNDNRTAARETNIKDIAKHPESINPKDTSPKLENNTIPVNNVTNVAPPTTEESWTRINHHPICSSMINNDSDQPSNIQLLQPHIHSNQQITNLQQSNWVSDHMTNDKLNSTNQENTNNLSLQKFNQPLPSLLHQPSHLSIQNQNSFQVDPLFLPTGIDGKPTAYLSTIQVAPHDHSASINPAINLPLCMPCNVPGNMQSGSLIPPTQTECLPVASYSSSSPVIITMPVVVPSTNTHLSLIHI